MRAPYILHPFRHRLISNISTACACDGAWAARVVGQGFRVHVRQAVVGAYAWASLFASRSYATAAALLTECRRATVHVGM
eukprot:3353358-Pyramimonas_sp.AAC.1